MLGLFNFDEIFMDVFSNLISSFQIIDINEPKDLSNLDSFFLNLFPKNYPNKNLLKNQINLIENAKQNKKRLFIFDGSLSLTDKEMKWLKNTSIIFEPALHNHDRSVYLPFWLKFNDLSDTFDSKYDIGFFGDGDLETEVADRLFFHPAKNLSLSFVTSKDCITSKEVEEKCKEFGVEILETQQPVKMVMFLPNKLHIKTGYMFDCQRWIRLKTPILFPSDMVYYNFMLKISNKDDILFWFKPKLTEAYLLQFKEDVKKYYPKMLIENVIKKVKEYV